MAIKLGSTDIADAKLGATQVGKICLGNTEVWNSAPAPAIKALKFSSTGAQTLGLNLTNLGSLTPNFEYSLDNGSTWTTWDVTTTISFGSGTDLYLRGSNNSISNNTNNVYTYVNFVFSTASPVVCSGNVMHLYNYVTDLTAFPNNTASDVGLYGLFTDCTALVTPPSLPATTLKDRCYSRLFLGCSNLQSAPDLPAMEVFSWGYSYMFSGCVNLTTPPALPATTVNSSGYRNMFYGCTSLSSIPLVNADTQSSNFLESMFYGCTSIKMSEAQDAEYPNEYSFKFVPSGTRVRYMFSETGGTFTGTPSLQTYYTANTVIN